MRKTSAQLCQNNIRVKFTGSVIIDAFEFSDVTMLHHHRQELDDDFGVGANEDLPLASLLRVVDAFERIGQYIHAEDEET